MLISVVIATINRKDELRQTLLAYKRQTHPQVELVVIDNGSRDGTREMISSEFPEVIYQWLPYNMGTHAINIGFEYSRGDIIWLSNNDSYPEDDCAFEQVVDVFRRFPHVHILGTEDIELNDGGRVYHWHPFDVDKSAVPPDGFVTNKFHGTGAGVRREVLDKVGGFWDTFIYEEIDLCTRAIVAGYNVRYFPNIRTLHLGAPRERVQIERRVMAAKNIVRYTWRYFPLWTALGHTVFYWAVYSLISLRHLNEPAAVLEIQFGMATEMFRAWRRERRVIPADKLRDVTLGKGIVKPILSYIGAALARTVRRGRVS